MRPSQQGDYIIDALRVHDGLRSGCVAQTLVLAMYSPDLLVGLDLVPEPGDASQGIDVHVASLIIILDVIILSRINNYTMDWADVHRSSIVARVRRYEHWIPESHIFLTLTIRDHLI